MVSAQQSAIVPTQPIPAKSLVIKTDKPRPYVCATCTRSFARLEHLKRHERSHTKEKPFQCPVCERSFARRDLLLRHKQKLHANSSPDAPSGKRNSISGPPPSHRSDMSPQFNSPFCGAFSPPGAVNPLNPLEHELMGGRPMMSFSRSQSFSAVAADSYMPDSLRQGSEDVFEDTINPQMLRTGGGPGGGPGGAQGGPAGGPHPMGHPPHPPHPHGVPPSPWGGPGPGPAGPTAAPVHMGIRRTRRFNSNASARGYVDSPDYSISSSLSQFDSPLTVPYQSPPDMQTPAAQQHVWPAQFQQQGLQPVLGMEGFEQPDDFVDSLLDLDDRFDLKGDWEEPQGDGQGGAQRQPQAGASASGASRSILHPEGPSQSPTGAPGAPQAPQGGPQPHAPQAHGVPHPPPVTFNPLSGFSSGFSSLIKADHPDDQLLDFPAYTPAPEPPAAPKETGLQNLPSSQEVRRLVSAFYSNMETYVHFIKNHDSPSQNMALVMSEAALGALFLGELQTARRIFDLSRDCIRMFSDLNNISMTLDSQETTGEVPLWLVQAATLSLMYHIFDFGTTTSQQVSQEAKILSAMAIRAQLHVPPKQVLPALAAEASVAEKYRFFQECEYRVRAMYAVYGAISYLAIFLGQKPLCTDQMLECGSPCDDELLKCATPEEWWNNIKGRGDKWCESMPFSFYCESISEGRMLGDNVHPIVLLSLICSLNHKLQHHESLAIEEQEKMIHTWEATWSSSKYAVNMDRLHSKHGLVMSDSAPIASLAMMRTRLSLQGTMAHIWNRDFTAMNRDLNLMRASHPDELVNAASYALDAIVTADNYNRKGEKLFLPSLMFLFEGAIVLSEALAVIEAMAQPVEKHQRLLMRAHKTFSTVVESDVYLFAQGSLFNLQDPAESLSRMALRVVIVLLQCNHPWPLSSFMVDVLRKRV